MMEEAGLRIPIALVAGFLLDVLLGDPRWLPHPVVAIGKAISIFETIARRVLPVGPKWEMFGGAAVALAVMVLSALVPWAILRGATTLDIRLSLVLECLMCYQALATKCLGDAAMEVYACLARGDLPAARAAVAMIVGRDTAELDEAGVTRATIETVAENASDGVVAPMLYFAIGGAPLAFLYKAVNTMDSMLGYKNEKYLYFGRIPARIDDVANFIPARLTSLLMVAASVVCRLDWRKSLAVYFRDRNNHSSPNSAHPEAAMAGALGVRLGGDSHYGGRLVGKPTIGDDDRPAAADDIRLARKLLYATALFSLGVCCAGAYWIHSLLNEVTTWI